MDYDYVDALLQSKSLSRRRLAELAGININTLASAFRRKSKKFPLEYILRIAKVLDVAWELIVNKKEYGFPPYSHTDKDVEQIEQAFGKFETEESIHYEKMLLFEFHKLSLEGKKTAVERIQELTEIPRYRRSDIETPPDAPEGA